MQANNRNTVLVTGGSRGIGAAISNAFANEGARIVIVYKSNLEASRNTLKELNGNGHESYKCDITQPAEIERLFTHINQEYDAIDLVVNNAGIGYHHPIDNCNFTEWQTAWSQIMASNLIGPSNVCYHAAQLMIQQKRGAIINVGSRGGYRGEPLMPAYGASKAGLHSMTQSLAYQLAPHNIFVGAVAPGFVETDMSRPRLQGEVGINIKGQSPMNRVAQPTEVADAVLKMSKANIWMTGSVWDVNGASYFR